MYKQQFSSFLFLVLFSLLLSMTVIGSEKSVEFTTGKIVYNIEGDGANTLVFVHCWTCNKDFWNKQVDFFKSKFKVISIDLPGHGDSDKPEVSYDMNLFADSIKAVMDQEKIDKAILIGHSMGVSVVRQFYRRYPENTQALVMVDSYLKFKVTPEMEKMIGSFMESFKKENSEAFIRMFLGNMFVKESPGEIKEWVITQMLIAPTHVRVNALENLWKPDIWIDDKIDVPVLVIRAKTPQLPPDVAENVKSVAANSKLEIWEGVGHFLHLEKPDKFNQSIMTFFKEKGFIE